MAVAYNEIDIQRSIEIIVRNTRDKSRNQFSTSISMVPSILRDLSPDSFNPRVVSIGPLHHGEENLKEIEGLKSSYMHSLLGRRSPIPERQSLDLKACLRWAHASIKEIRACYVGIRTYSDHELARMMVMDVCFILEFIYNNREETELFRYSVFKDLLLVENQIPFFVLINIFEILKTDPNASLIDSILPVIRSGYFSLYRHVSIDRNACADSTNHHHHILGLLQKCCQSAHSIPSDHSKGPESFKIHNVTELDKAGVNFKHHVEETWPMAIRFGHLPRFAWCSRFWCKPTLRMPVLYINDMTELVLRNLIAFEQKSKNTRHVSSYATVIDKLIDTHEDIAMLVEYGIIYNIMGSNEEAANMVNSICKNVPADYSVYIHELEQLDTYCNGYWPRHIARLRRTYFNSPWNIIALLAAIILFAVTITDTILTAVQI